MTETRRAIHFYVSEQPCIPVVQRGQPKLVTLQDALVHANEYTDVQHDVSILEFGLYRLLTAFVLDIFFVEPGEQLDTLALSTLLDEGHFDATRIDAYLEKYHHEFDLFSEKRPFLQTAGLMSELKPISSMMPIIPSGTNAVHFHRAHEDEYSVSPAEALAVLASVAPFMTEGGRGLSPSINGAPPIYVLVQGNTLFETLCLNIAATPPKFARAEDAPAWRSSRMPGEERQDAGHVESLTWRPRRVQLALEEDGTAISSIRFEAGDSTRFEWRDPSAAYRLTEKGSMIVRMHEGRELWRDSGPLLLLSRSDKAERPLLVTQFSRLRREGVLPRKTSLALSLYGIRTYEKGANKKMKIFEWQREHLSIPSSLLSEDSQTMIGQEVADWLESADLVAFHLRKSIKKLHPETARNDSAEPKAKRRDSDLKGFLTRSVQAERSYWSALRGVFEELIVQLAEAEPTLENRMALRDEWRKAVEQEAKAAFERVADGLSTDSHALERVTRARRVLLGGIKNTFDPPPPGKSRQGKGAA
jgi:CRISPR system Cascade subunit CasA